ncbi:PAAR domain-containing protein [Herbaspirillum sp. C9C3]|uniref:PAAR domain-containing protein n=1 Tax=Herbaspirillum sp. C9C3 TaxID=2735271 RepID=UPI0015852DB8|nr:PAAR domain-containing protein [Herbaspirillum sp. C9C3]NUT61312.1 PAAR domain-containing protein [Herbaspirillum sp. C9C3]
MARAIIRQGDPTSHGGIVQEGFSNFTLFGKPMAGVGHRGYCPQCRSVFSIVEGAEQFRYLGRQVAVEGMMTSCGAVLQATQRQVTADEFTATAQAAQTRYGDRYLLRDQHGNPIAHAEYALSIAGGAPQFGLTDAHGRTHMTATAAQRWEVDIYLEG